MSADPKPPIMSEQQRATGRQVAVAGRRARAELKQELRQGRIDFMDILRIAERDDERGRAAVRLRVGEVLLALPGVGPAQAERLLARTEVSGQRRIGQLGERQQERLEAAL